MIFSYKHRFLFLILSVVVLFPTSVVAIRVNPWVHPTLQVRQADFDAFTDGQFTLLSGFDRSLEQQLDNFKVEYQQKIDELTLQNPKNLQRKIAGLQKKIVDFEKKLTKQLNSEKANICRIIISKKRELETGRSAVQQQEGLSLNSVQCTYNCPAGQCGNGVLEGKETCDDGNTVNDDGCSSSCRQEKQFLRFSRKAICDAPAKLGDF